MTFGDTTVLHHHHQVMWFLNFFFPKQNSFVETVFVTSGPSTLRGAQFEQKSSANLKKKKNKEIPIFFFQDEHVTVFFFAVD